MGDVALAPQRPCILVVDDEDALRRIFVRVLSKTGHEVIEAASGARAVELLGERKFDVILSDLGLGDMDGLELLRIAHERQPDVAVVLITGAPQLESAMAAVAHDAFEYLAKPVDLDRLVTSVQRAIERHRTDAERRRLAESASRQRTGPEVGQVAVGDVLAGKYRLLRVVGTGGMGTVYEAIRDDLRMPVAVKVLHSRFVDRPDILARFRREAEIIATIDHPNIVKIVDVGPNDGPAFLVMELLHGETLATAIDEGAELSEERVAFIASQVLAALSAAHDARVIHRDLKPDNVFLTAIAGIADVVKVLDFGVAKVLGPLDPKLTETGIVVGTPAYIPPEYARGDAIDERADIYGVGVIMYEALARRPPFIAGGYNALLHAIQKNEPPPIRRIDVSDEMIALIARAMAKAPQDRFASAAEMRGALDPWLPRPSDRAGFSPTIQIKRGDR